MDTTLQLQTKHRVMRSVYVRFIVRKLAWFSAAGAGFLVAFLVAVGYLVSLEQIAQNVAQIMQSGSLLSYLYSAIARTEITLQVLMAAGFCFGVLFGFRTVLAVKAMRRLPEMESRAFAS